MIKKGDRSVRSVHFLQNVPGARNCTKLRIIFTDDIHANTWYNKEGILQVRCSNPLDIPFIQSMAEIYKDFLTGKINSGEILLRGGTSKSPSGQTRSLFTMRQGI